jgi:hypothetical protein
MTDVLSSERADESRQAIVAIASSQSTAIVLPMVTTQYFSYIFETAERRGFPLFQRVFNDFFVEILAED